MKKTNMFICLILAALLILPSCSASMSPSNRYEEGENDRNGYSYTVPPEQGYNYDPQAVQIKENEFIKTAENAVSTFSADVDTASYTYLRRRLNNTDKLSGIMDHSGNIRTEELINYFKYDYKEPVNGDLFGVSAKLVDCPWNDESSLLILGLQTEKAKVKTDNNLVFLIDVSGSMYGEDKLPLLQKTFSYLLSALDENDTVSIVTYSAGEKVVLEGCAGNETETIQSAIDSLEARGSTNGEAGMKTAYQIAEKYYKPNGNNRIIMASDGDLNVGISSVDGIKKFVSDKRGEGVYLSVLGFGYGNYRDSIMEAIADCGNGVYYYIDGAAEAEKIFCDDLLSTLYTVAEDVKLQITFQPDNVAEYRLIGYENRIMKAEDFKNDKKDAGELGAGHRVTVCYELKLSVGRVNTEKLFDFAVRYKKPGADASIQNDYEMLYSEIKTEHDRDTNFIAALCELTMLLHKSKYGENVTLASVRGLLSRYDYKDDTYKYQLITLLYRLKDDVTNTADNVRDPR